MRMSRFETASVRSHTRTRLVAVFVFASIVASAPRVALGARQEKVLASTSIVISQVYGGGGNSGATLTNDFVELFNLGSTPVTVTGWSVQYASTAGSTWQVTNLSGTIQPGHYYLVQEAAGTGGTTPLPTPDATGSIAMSATAGKVALVSSTTGLTGSCPTGGTIVDFVGYGPATTCSETSPTSPNLSNTTAAIRANGGCTDTDNNLADFATGAPNPRNSASPTNSCGPQPALTLAVAPSTFSEGAGAGAATGTVTRVDDPGGNAADLDVTLTNPDTSEVSVPATVTIPAGQASITFAVDAVDDGLVDGTQPVTLTASASGFADGGATVQVVDDDGPITLISTIQGDVTVLASPANRSTLQGATVTIRGVVTNVTTNGFWVQEEKADDDGNANTSEGIFVFTSTAPTVSLGNVLLVSGRVSEFTPGSGQLPVTEITSPVAAFAGNIADAAPAGVDVMDLRNAVNIRTLTDLPDTLIYDPMNPDNPNTGIEFWETIEGMLVEVTTGTVVSGTAFFGASREFTVVAPGDAVAGSGYFPTTHNLIIQPFDPPYTNPASPPTIGGGDFNPERIIVNNKNGLLAAPNVAADGTVVNNIVGTVDYDFSNPRIQPVFSLTDVVPGSQNDALTSQGADLRVVTFNVENLFDSIDESGRADSPILTPAEIALKISKITHAIVDQLALPDIFIVEEVESEAMLQQIATSVNTATGGTTNYVARSLDAADDRSIQVGFIYNSARTHLVSAFGSSTLLTPPNVVGDDQHTRSAPVGPFADVNLGTAFLADSGKVFEGGPGAPFPDSREPLVGVFRYQGCDVLVVGVHLASKGGDQALYGVNQPPTRTSEAQRKQQALYVRQLVDLFLVGDPSRSIPSFRHILVAGDYNDFTFPEQGEVGMDAVGIVQGFGVAPNAFLQDLANYVPADERYSFIFDGNSQDLDHMLVSPDLFAKVVGQDIAHFNVDYPDSFATDPTTAFKTSDHDPLVGTFQLDTAPPSITCPQNVTTVATDDCGAAVTYPAPTATDDCGVASVVCVPASGSFFAVGTTTVNCTATDFAGKTASCSFRVIVTPRYNVCVIDDLSRNRFRWNTTTGAYEFLWNDTGTVVTGVGIPTGTCTFRLRDMTGGRRVDVTANCNASGTGIAVFPEIPGRTFRFSDRNVGNNTCSSGDCGSVVSRTPY